MDGWVRCATLICYPELARSLGLDPERLLADEGMHEADLADQDRWIPAAPVARLLERSATESGREDLGVRLAAQRRLSALGPLSVVLREEPDLGSALRLLIRYQHAYNGILDLRLEETDELATVQVWLDFGEPVPLQQAVDQTAATVVSLIRALMPADWQPLVACFSHAAPADLSAFHDVFGPELRFGAEFTGVTFPARDLHVPNASADPVLRSYTGQLLATLPVPRAATSSTLAGEVGALVEFLLPHGRCSMTEVSRLLDVQPRTLHRRLAAEGQSFTEIVQTTRARLATRRLADERFSLTEISGLLGFATPSAFSTWFRQHLGTSPSEWRARAAAVARDPGVGAEEDGRGS